MSVIAPSIEKRTRPAGLLLRAAPGVVTPWSWGKALRRPPTSSIDPRLPSLDACNPQRFGDRAGRWPGVQVQGSTTSWRRAWASRACSPPRSPRDRQPPARRRRHHRGLRRGGAQQRRGARRRRPARGRLGRRRRARHGRVDRRRRARLPQFARLAGPARRHAAGAAGDAAGGGARARPSSGRLRPAPRPARPSGRLRRRALLGAGRAERRRRRAPPGRALSGVRRRARRPGRADRHRHRGRPGRGAPGGSRRGVAHAPRPSAT